MKRSPNLSSRNLKWQLSRALIACHSPNILSIPYSAFLGLILAPVKASRIGQRGRSHSALLSVALTDSPPAGYDEEAHYFESGVRSSKRQELKSQASAELKRGFDRQVALLQQRCLAIAKEAMAQTESDSSQFLSLAQQ